MTINWNNALTIWIRKQCLIWHACQTVKIKTIMWVHKRDEDVILYYWFMLMIFWTFKKLLRTRERNNMRSWKYWVFILHIVLILIMVHLCFMIIMIIISNKNYAALIINAAVQCHLIIIIYCNKHSWFFFKYSVAWLKFLLSCNVFYLCFWITQHVMFLFSIYLGSEA